MLDVSARAPRDDGEAMHNSLPNLHFNEQSMIFPPAEMDHDAAAAAAFHRSLPNLRHDRPPMHMGIEPNQTVASLFPQQEYARHHRQDAPISFDHLGRVERFGGPRRDLSDGDLKKAASWPKITNASPPSSSDSSNAFQGDRDLLACLEKLTEHSISEGNPYEPIPLAGKPIPKSQGVAHVPPPPRDFQFQTLPDDDLDHSEFAEG